MPSLMTFDVQGFKYCKILLKHLDFSCFFTTASKHVKFKIFIDSDTK